MPYIIYNKQHGPSAYVAGTLNTAALRENEIAIPCEEGADVNDTARWTAEAAQITDVDAARIKASATLDQKRRAVEYGGFVFNGQRWDSEAKDELRLNSMMTMMDKLGLAEFPGWKISTDTFIVLTPETAMQAAVVMMQHYNACFAVEEAKKAEIDALKRAEDIAAWLETSLNTGWPGQAE